MKKYLYLFGTIILFSLNVSAQKPPPPPPPPAPLIYSAPEKSKISEFSSGKFNFKIDFAGQPAVSELKIGNGETTQFSTKINGSNETVKISDFNFDLEKKPGKADVFEQVKQKYLSDEYAELIYEKDVGQNGLQGKEFGLKIFIEFYRVRVFVKGGRIYELIATVTNWGILEKVDGKQKEFNDEADRFFGSFRIEKFPPVPAAELAGNEKIELFKDESKTFESKQGGFKVYFPKMPEMRTNQIDSGFGKAVLHVFTASTALAFYGVSYADYPAAITDQTEVRYVSDAQRDLLMARNYKLVSEKDISYKGNYGREYVLNYDGNTVVMRNFFVRQRLFRLLVITRGIKGKISSAEEEKNSRAAFRFLDSFEVTEIPKPEFSEINLPGDFGVKVENSVFYSEFFGVTMTVPEGWTVLDDETAAVLREIGLMALEKEEDERINLNTQKSLQNTKFIFTAVKLEENKPDEVSILMIAAEKMSVPNFLPEAAAAAYLRESLSANEEAVGGVNKTKFDGVDFAWVETIDKKENLKQRLYFANLKNIAFEITFTYNSEADLKEFVEKLNTIKIKKQ